MRRGWLHVHVCLLLAGEVITSLAGLKIIAWRTSLRVAAFDQGTDNKDKQRPPTAPTKIALLLHNHYINTFTTISFIWCLFYSNGLHAIFVVYNACSWMSWDTNTQNSMRKNSIWYHEITSLTLTWIIHILIPWAEQSRVIYDRTPYRCILIQTPWPCRSPFIDILKLHKNDHKYGSVGIGSKFESHGYRSS